MAIGIFDSGMGGISVLYEAIKQLPHENFIYYGDSKYAPYGTKTIEEVITLSKNICDYFISRGVKAIVIACNTATSAAIKVLRQSYDIPIIGMEPALKLAVENNEGHGIAVMATPMTLKEKKFCNLMNRVASQHTVYKIPAPKIVELVEQNNLSKVDVDTVILSYFAPFNDIESVVLGCTHFIFIKENLKRLLGKNIKIIDGNYGTVMQLKRKLEEKNQLCNQGIGDVEIINSAGDDMIRLSHQLLEKLEAYDGN